METFLLSVLVILLAGLGLAAGLLLRGRALRRGCGGIVRAAGGAPCPGCPLTDDDGKEAP